MKLSYRLLAALSLAACSSDPNEPAGPITASLTGTWNAPSSGVIYNLQLQLTEASPSNVTGQWSAYETGCAPLNSPGCLRGGNVASGARNGLAITLELIPSSACGMVNATITATFSSQNTATGTFVQHRCNAVDRNPASLTLTRQ